jgi:hypothetical protein
MAAIQKKKNAGKRGSRGNTPKSQLNSKGEEMVRDEELIRSFNKQYPEDRIDPYMGNVNLPTDKSTFRYNEERELAIKRSCEDIIFFAENFFYVISLDDGKQKIKLHDYQKNMLNMIMGNRRNIICTARQAGKTTIMTIYVLWIATFFEYQNVVLVANKEDSAKEILKRIKLAYEELPGWMKPAVDRGGWSKESINFSNGSSIRISATSVDSIRGKSCNCITGENIITLRDKVTGEVIEVPIEWLYNTLNVKENEIFLEII